MERELERILDNLDSQSLEDIAKGLVALEYLLKSASLSIRKYYVSGVVDSRLAALINLQSNVRFNVTIGLLLAYATFSNSPEKVTDGVVKRANYLLSGMLLIHPESRALFGRGQNMALMLTFLHSESSFILEDLSVSFVSLFIHILMKNVKNVRLFEANNGCQHLIHHLNVLSTGTNESNTKGYIDIGQRDLHFKVIEFLIFYLADETELLSLPQNYGARTISVKEKAELFRPEFPEIDDLIRNLSDLTSLR